jgi:hypothetical protein
MTTLSFLLLIGAIAIISGTVFYKGYGGLYSAIIMIFSTGYLLTKAPAVVEEIPADEYKTLLSVKATCYKYDDCKKYFDNMVKEYPIRVYELEDFKTILDKNVKEQKEREEYSKQIQQQIDKDNEIDRIKQELRNKH